MDETLHQLGRILLNAVPTFFIVLFLILFLRSVFFGPLAAILKRRYEETEGAQKAAQESMRQAELRVSEYEEKLRVARGEIYAQQDKLYKQMESDHSARLDNARRSAEAEVAAASAQLQAEADEARRLLQAQGSDLADRIVNRILEGRAA